MSAFILIQSGNALYTSSQTSKHHTRETELRYFPWVRHWKRLDKFLFQVSSDTVKIQHMYDHLPPVHVFIQKLSDEDNSVHWVWSSYLRPRNDDWRLLRHEPAQWPGGQQLRLHRYSRLHLCSHAYSLRVASVGMLDWDKIQYSRYVGYIVYPLPFTDLSQTS